MLRPETTQREFHDSIMRGKQNPPSCFMSYSWEGPELEDWVLNLATRLVKNGVIVVLDKWDLKLGDDLGHFMETSVRESGSVIMVCTPIYAKKANAGTGGAGYEKQIVTGEMFQGVPASKFIPLIRKGSDQEALPSFLKSKNYVDFRDDSQFEKKLEDLLRQLHDAPKFSRPTLGKPPFDTSTSGRHVTRTAPKISELPPPLDMALAPPRTKPRTEQNGAYVTYCRKCGVLPGAQTQCIGLLTSSHSFTVGTGIIYCSCCGKIAGRRSECTRVLTAGHDFVSGNGSEFCLKCGAKLGMQERACTGTVCHDFIRPNDPVGLRRMRES